MKKILVIIIVMAISFNVGKALEAQATTLGYADVVLAYSNSGTGDMPVAYGGTWDGTTGTYPVEVDLDVVVGDDPGYPGAMADFLSLPTGSFVILGFTDETVINGIGDDIFITEVGANSERAEVLVSSDGTSFTSLGIVNDDVTTALDLEDFSFFEPVTAIKIVGLDLLGGSKGFDLINVGVYPGSIGPTPIPSTHNPEPGTMLLLGTGLVGVAGAARRRKKNQA